MIVWVCRTDIRKAKIGELPFESRNARLYLGYRHYYVLVFVKGQESPAAEQEIGIQPRVSRGCVLLDTGGFCESGTLERDVAHKV